MKDLMTMMKQAEELQGRMQQVQDELAALQVEGQSGGGLVKVTLNGKMEAKGVKIDPSLAKPEDVEVLEDLILAAFQDAKGKAEAALQQKMQEVQAELDTIEVEGAAGGGVVKVTTSAKGEARRVSIDPSLMNPDETEILEDLLVAALNDARAKGERAMQARMEEITKGLPLPPGMKLF